MFLKNKTAWLFVLLILLTAICFVMSLSLGYVYIPLSDIFKHFILHEQIKEAHILSTIRLPRAIIAGVVGVLMAMSGVMIQTITRNPFASPSIMGINSGAGLFVMLAVTLFHFTGGLQTSLAALVGAMTISGLIILATTVPRKPLNLLELTLLGACISAFSASITQGLLIYNKGAIDQMVFWMSGSVAQNTLGIFPWITPLLIVGLILAVYISPQLNIFAVGDDLLQGIGMNVLLLKVITMLSVALLAGCAVMLAGPIGFIGLITPHVAKLFYTKNQHLVLLPLSALFGASLLLASDVLSRFLLMPRDIPVGITTAFLGVPVFLWLIVRKRGMQS